ncbi:MAG: YqcI/YcgG family protein [Marivirga sp.]|nr:YqcI/YcgG family protein [Marivirga sp.]
MKDESIIDAYLEFLGDKGYPCIAAKAALSRSHIHCMVAGDMAQSTDDKKILNFLYHFVDHYRMAKRPYHSASIIFQEPQLSGEEMFDRLLWSRLNALAMLDREKFAHDPRVDSCPHSPRFSFSIKAEAFFIIGLNPLSKRKSRAFKYPSIVFNPHQEFERLRRVNKYEQMKKAVRKRDTMFSGSVNPMLTDFGEASEVFQYSGIQYKPEWVCPLKHNN